MILNSSTYQQASTHAPETISRDPENRLFSRAEVRRLEAEAVRDSLLATSGQLDTTIGGSLLQLKNRAYFFDHTSIDKTTYDSPRRSLYLPVVRNNVFDVFQLLDFPDPAVSGSNRATTVVASQALLMLNSDLVMHAATRLADRLLAEPVDFDQRLSRLYVIAFGREPTDDERQADQAFLARVTRAQAQAPKIDAHPESETNANTRQQQAWSTLCHVVLAANEFIYVR